MAGQTEQWEERVDRVVRDVLARLKGNLSPDGASLIGNHDPTSIEEVIRAEHLVLSDRVVTCAVLDGRLDGVKAVSVPVGAVVTPAARDVLREEGVQLSQATETCGRTQPSNCRINIGVAECIVEPVSVRRLQDALGVPLEPLVRVGLVEVVREMSEQVVMGGAKGILFTTEPAAALCLANRRRGVRAIGGRRVDEIGRSVAAVGANLLVVDPTGLTTWSQIEIAREFARRGSRTCPAAFAELLG
jgi:hypothetical protein